MEAAWPECRRDRSVEQRRERSCKEEPMSDQIGTNRLFLSPPHMSGRELRYVEEAFASNYVAPAGPMIERFERDFAAYTGIAHTVALASGTAAIHLALLNLEIEPGDEFWASTLTFLGSIGAAIHERLVPVFFEPDSKSWNLDPDLLGVALDEAAQRGRLPKVVIPTELYGQACDLDAILAHCARHGVPVICDSAEAVGTRYKNRHAGKGAFATAFSFNGNKIMTTSGGGLLASDDKSIIDRARYLSTQARQSVVHYEHTEVGFNYRMSNISAAIGVGQMEVVEERVARRRAIFARYVQRLLGLPGISFMPEADYGRTTRWLTVIRIDQERFGATREQVRAALEEYNIESRPVWKPMHMQPVFAGARHFGGRLSEQIFTEGLCLPSGSSMDDCDVERVAGIIAEQCRAD
ncbi:MAG: aminotransferase class I/II-fold pyridoxal phosphate-dependent enzyme [Terriglobia bacterium]|nr:aminotransferase class I/II-fold pyridoxal phosphate-dependent enzyme [Terriglobia bacterium]